MDTENFIRKLRDGSLTRRQFVKGLSAAGIGFATGPALSTLSHAAAKDAIYFTWGGYDDDGLFGGFIEKHGGPPAYSIFADGEEAIQKLNAGHVADVVHPCNYDTPRYIDSGLIQPWDLGRIGAWNDVSDYLKNQEVCRRDGQQYFAPFDWGRTSITYRTDLYQPEEESWAMLWDPKLKGKLAIIDSAEDSWWATALYAGVDLHNIKPDDDEVFEKVAALLREQRPLLRMYSSDMASLQQALASGEIWAAMTWDEAAVSLKWEGHPVEFAKPKEGAMTWNCGVVLMANAPNLDGAYDIINAMLAPETGQYLITQWGYGHSNMKAYDLVTDDELFYVGLSRDVKGALEEGVFVTNVDPLVSERANREFEEIKAGF